MKRTRRGRSKLILVLGGAASGKSAAALELAGEGGPRAFVATGQALDQEMAERIARHRATRSFDWNTAEVPINLAAWFRKQGTRYRMIVLDCLTLWLSNLHGRRVRGTDVSDRVADLLDAIRSTTARVVVVSNELGLGLVPAGKSVRSFRDLAGRMNQQIAAEADEVYLVIGGLRWRLK